MTTIVGHIRNDFPARMAQFSAQAVKVWLAMATHADKAGTCYPSIRMIMVESGLPRSSVYKGIRELTEAGEVEVVSRGDAAGTSNVYQFAASPPDRPVRQTDQSATETNLVRHRDKN